MPSRTISAACKVSGAGLDGVESGSVAATLPGGKLLAGGGAFLFNDQHQTPTAAPSASRETRTAPGCISRKTQVCGLRAGLPFFGGAAGAGTAAGGGEAGGFGAVAAAGGGGVEGTGEGGVAAEFPGAKKRFLGP